MTKTENIKVKGYRGTWSVIDECDAWTDIDVMTRWLMLEHNYYGDETCYLVIEDTAVNWKPNNVYEGIVFETFDGIETCLEDEGII